MRRLGVLVILLGLGGSAHSLVLVRTNFSLIECLRVADRGLRSGDRIMLATCPWDDSYGTCDLKSRLRAARIARRRDADRIKARECVREILDTWDRK